MNEASKLIVATALVALGLGFAYLCGPPADAPEVIRDSSALLDGQSLKPPDATVSATLRLHADAPPSAEVLAGGSAPQPGGNARSNSRGIVLSAAEADADNDPKEPRWFAPEATDDDPAPPRSVEVDDQAVPLSAVAPQSGNAATDDEWLLKPPAMPRSYDAKSAAAPSPSLASGSSARREEASQDAWWTRDTPRLQGLSGIAPAESREPAPPAAQNTRLAAPIDLDAVAAATPPIGKPTESAGSAPPAVVQPRTIAGRTHLITDGDTLARLAERYLQDAARAREIFELNREVLRDPNLLPIGVALRIPGDPAQSGLELDETTATGRLVPVAAPPRVNDSPTRARLQSPEPIAASAW